MDIRRWFTSSESSKSSQKGEKGLQAKTKIEKEANPKKVSKAVKKRRLVIESDSDDEDPIPSKNRHVSPKKKKKASEEDLIDTDSDSDIKKAGNTSKKIVQQKDQQALKSSIEKIKVLKQSTASSFFGSTPIERSSKIATPKSKKMQDIVELNHEDDDFCKTLQQLDQETKKEAIKDIPSEKKAKGNYTEHQSSSAVGSKEISKEVIKDTPSEKKTKGNFTEPQSPSAVGSKGISKKAIKDTPPQKKTKGNYMSFVEHHKNPSSLGSKEISKESVKDTPPSAKKKRGNANYMSYLERQGPKALGSKEIPEGEEGCFRGKTFVITGVLESIEREEAKSLIEKYGGKVMSTLTKNSNYVVIGRDAGPSKLEKAEKFGTKQLDEDGLFNLLKTLPGIGGHQKNKIATLKKSENFVQEEKPKESCVTLNNDLLKNSDAIKSIQPANDTLGDKESNKSVFELKPISNPSPDKVINPKSMSQMWVDKYKPVTVKQIIGQQGDKSNCKKLLYWLTNWSKRHKTNKKPMGSGKWNSQDDGSNYNAALLSGPPGVGKTTTAQLVCKEAGFDYFELNASDTRSKKSLQQVVSQLLGNRTLGDCFKAGTKGTVSRNHVVIMDEVDGMAGNEDRGGVQELIAFVKASKVPIICICNDRSHPKIRSLSNYCFDLRFQRPRVEQIKASMMSIAFKEGIKITPNVLQDVITASNQDIRQVLHNLSLWCAKEKGLSAEQAKSDIGKGTKHIKLGPFDVLREVFAIGNNSKATINDKADLFFHDYSIAPLFVQENYVHVQPSAAKNDKLKHLHLLSETAESICIGDLVDKQIRTQNSWNLLPTQAIFASVLPGELMSGHLQQMINFPAWLGKNSSRNHMDRILQQLQTHMRMRITGNKTEVALEYLPLLKRSLTKPLLEKEELGIKDTLKVMEYYYLLREDFDSIIELSLWPQQTDPRTKISTKVKSAFTRTYNKECGQNPYAVTNFTKKKASAKDSQDSLLGEEEGSYVSDENNEDDEKLENDAMIKVKKPTKKATSSDKKASVDKKGSKPESKKGKSKK